MPISFTQALGMRFRGTPVDPMRRAWAEVERLGLAVTLDQLEAHSLAGGHVERVVEAMVAARARGLTDNFLTLSAVDLAGQDPMAAVAHGYNLRALGFADA